MLRISRIARLRGKRRSFRSSPARLRSRFTTSSESPRSRMVKLGSRPTCRAARRSTRLAKEWKVPPATRSQLAPTSPAARRSISSAALRVKVRRRICPGLTPDSTTRATRYARVLLAALFATAGMFKLAANPDAVAAFERLGFGQWFRVFVGICEVAGALGLLVTPLAALAAAGLALLMVGAVFSHVLVL